MGGYYWADDKQRGFAAKHVYDFCYPNDYQYDNYDSRSSQNDYAEVLNNDRAERFRGSIDLYNVRPPREQDDCIADGTSGDYHIEFDYVIHNDGCHHHITDHHNCKHYDCRNNPCTHDDKSPLLYDDQHRAVWPDTDEYFTAI